ncbi:MAG TPA: ATP-binding protein [Chryseolinea sp.]|nr:ATP-binding protein [Chryseolinea sp.]
MQTINYDITIFLIITTLTILFLAGLIISLIYLYEKKKISYSQRFEAMKLSHENNLLETKLEIQEITFQTISREIHDNINLSLTLAKLHLNTINWNEVDKCGLQIDSSINLLSESIQNLSNISKSLNSEIIKNQGLIIALENEIHRIISLGLLTIELAVTGEPIYMDNQKELLIFRIIQEAFNNIIKHSGATIVLLTLKYEVTELRLCIIDNGKGFYPKSEELIKKDGKAGLSNMSMRAKMMGGEMKVESKLDQGTSLYINIPFI